MNNSNLTILGEGFACLDIIRFEDEETVMLGGTAANVLTILSVLGLKTEFLTARYNGLSGKYLESAFIQRGILCISFVNAKNQAPKIIEGLEKGKHFFATKCPKCGQNLVKCNLPTLGQLKKIENQYNNSPNVFFFDRISEGIIQCAKQNQDGWNIYEPNSCRIYTNLLNGINIANIVKYSEDRISAKLTDNVVRDIKDTNVVLLIVTMGERGIKYIYRNETGELSDWNYIAGVQIDNVLDSSGSGDWLTAVFLYLLLKKYPHYTLYLREQFVKQSLIMAQKYAAKNCSFVGAQGMLREQHIINQINNRFSGEVQVICDPSIEWGYDCDYCFNEHV